MAFLDHSSYQLPTGQPMAGQARISLPDDQIDALLKLEEASEESARPPRKPARKQPKQIERLAEDMYAQHTEDSGIWAKSKEGSLVYRWNGWHWEEIEQEPAEADAMRWLRRHYPDQACQRKAAACCCTARLTLPWLPPVPNGRCLISCLDGWLELIGDRFVRIAPDKTIGVTHAVQAQLGALPLGADYIPAPVSGRFAEYLGISQPDESVRAMIQEYIGYTLLPHSFLNLQVAMVFLGDGADGKGLLAGLVRRLHRRTCGMNLKALDGFGAEGLIGATLALVDEGPSRGVIDDERIKTMISGDALDINRKHRIAVTYRPQAKWIILCNTAPKFCSSGLAIHRRFLYAPWTASLPDDKRIANLEDLIADTELKGVLDWALAGALALVKRGKFEIPDPAVVLKQSAAQSADTVLGWKAEVDPRIAPDVQTPKNEIYGDYVDWCKEQGRGSVGAETFWMRLRKYLGVTDDEQWVGQRITINGKRVLTVRLLIHQAPIDDNEPPPF